MNIIDEKELKNRLEILRKNIKDRNLNGIIVIQMSIDQVIVHILLVINLLM